MVDIAEVTLAERGQIVIPKEARDALGLKPGARLHLSIEGGRLLIEKRVQLDLAEWIGCAVDDGLTTDQALTELRGRAVPFQPPALAHTRQSASAKIAKPANAPKSTKAPRA